MRASTLDWLVVGGGLHGSLIGNAIARAAPTADVAIVDPQPALANWQRRAAACGMDFLRSSVAHHLGARAASLRDFAAARGFDPAHTLGVYRRPSRALFEAHAAAQPRPAARITDTAIALVPAGNGWRVHLAGAGALGARRVVLATGPGRPWRPRALADARHVFDADFRLARAPRCSVVVGGGITGAQLALRATAAGHAVTWLTRRAPRVADFDSDPCYAGRKCLEPFVAASAAQRSGLIARARRPATLTPDVYARLTARLAAGDIGWRAGDARDLTDSGVRLASGGRVTADDVVLATGFESAPQPGGLLAQAAERLALATDADGHLSVDDDLAAAPGLHVVGRPASLALGPMAGNIKGARLAAARLAALAARTPQRPARTPANPAAAAPV